MQHFGQLPGVEEALLRPGFTCKADEPATLYAMVEGGHLLTDEGYRDTKVGRVFAAEHLQQVPTDEEQVPTDEEQVSTDEEQVSTDEEQVSTDEEQVKCRMRLERSDYLAHLGHYRDFTARFDRLLKSHLEQAPAGSKLVLLSEGADWIARWQRRTYPEAAIMILDFYPAVEHLADFATLVFTSSPSRKTWIKQQCRSLKAGRLAKVMLAIRTKAFDRRRSCIRTKADKLLAYYQNNRYRMQYDEYLAQGLTIGSGAIESAISTLVQQRCKLVGQRWTAQRVAAVLNVRALYHSSKQDQLLKIINQQMGYEQAA